MEAVGTLTQEIIDLRKQMTDLQAKFDTDELINPLDETPKMEDDQDPEP